MSEITTLEKFDIDLFECGSMNFCLYSWFCPCAAIAEAKSLMDESDFFFNSTCLNVVTMRWLIRTAYGIPGDACNDCLMGCFCLPCTANQILQTTNNHRNPTADGGRAKNRDEYRSAAQSCSFSNCLWACCCPFCAVGTGLEQSLGMPWLFGCLCVAPCASYQLQRYQYRIKGFDISNDIIIPTCLAVLSYYTAGIGCLCFGPYLVVQLMKFTAEADLRKGGDPRGYLSGYTMYEDAYDGIKGGQVVAAVPYTVMNDEL